MDSLHYVFAVPLGVPSGRSAAPTASGSGSKRPAEPPTRSSGPSKYEMLHDEAELVREAAGPTKRRRSRSRSHDRRRRDRSRSRERVRERSRDRERAREKPRESGRDRSRSRERDRHRRY